MDDGDARGLEEQAAATAEVARELREAVAALAVRRAADEDALRRSAVALDGDLRRLQGSVAALEPAALDKVEEDLEHANLAILDSHVAAFLPNKGNDLLPFVSFDPFCFGSSLIVSLRVMFKLTMSEPLGKFLKKFVGPVNVRIARKEDKLKVKDGYNNYRDRAAYMFLLFPSILLLLRWCVWDRCLPALAVQMYQAWLLFLYTSFALRENVLLVNGSDIRP